MNVLLTGGTGNLGSRLLIPLIQRGDRVVIYDLQDKPFIPSAEFQRCAFIRGDLTDRESIVQAVREEKIDSIFHLGAILSAQAELQPDKAWTINMEGIRNALEAARLGKVKKFIFSSTLATYGAGLPSPLEIDSPMWPQSLYGVTKVAGELLGVYYHHRFGLDFRAIRFPSVVAPRGMLGGAGRFTSEVFLEAVEKGAYEFYLRPDSSIPIVYIADAIKSFLLFHDAPEKNLTRRSYNIHARGVTPEQLEAVVKTRLPHVKITYKPEPVQTAMVDSWPHSLNDRHAREDWGWQETYDLERMADEVIATLQKQKESTDA